MRTHKAGRRWSRLATRLLVVTMLALPAAAFGAGGASAFGGAFYPAQRLGNRGVDVLAIEYLLQHHGHDVPADGQFTSSVDTAVRAFQSARGLGVDGIVGPRTWAALVVTIGRGASGPAVRAVQEQLNEKRNAGLAVSGTFDDATHAAVVAFQGHAAIAADGIVGAVTWTNLAWHYAYPDMSAGLCDQDPDGNGTANWATGAAVAQLEAAAASFAGTGQGQVPLGDASREHGGDIPGHSSHEVGLDIDVWPIRTDSAQCTAGRITWRSSTYDRAATRQLVQAIRSAAPGHVRLVFFNDPTLIAEGLTTEYAGHDNHLHIRYCERVHPNSLYTC
ncbi:penicillin-insensitive murein endopeptidase [Phytohabitans sp. ZYX-F-186]|uniref:Penicillin-insensitive murein endopeptidase n=1 Tax=Phytohabitans maris TaxID=3071409 RepID=A0ABU0ZMS3_9ACTN|nr:penicillin-insensitive murein endopeptidase [Phytohabitans sp. ZYX-F-186]MDQ7908258.1 penicillin-insensitive murein endopeptidase [Phytohabitans sp. ZYX-F-186]